MQRAILNFGNYNNFAGVIRSQFAGSGNMQWYIGQHGKVRSALQNNDLRGAVEAAAALEDLGVSGKSVAQVMNSPELLQAFKNSILVRHAPAGFYKDVAGKVPNLIDPVLAELFAIRATPVVMPMPTPMPAPMQPLIISTPPVIVDRPAPAQPNWNNRRRSRNTRRDTRPPTQTTAAPSSGGTYFTADGVERKIITDPTKIEAQGGKVTGTDMTVKQALTSKDQYSFTRSSVEPGSNRLPNFWSDLGPPPAGYNEQIYLAKNPDVAKAVREGAMPSGLWHYLKYGKNENRVFSGWSRNRRPGYLSGIFANWNCRD